MEIKKLTEWFEDLKTPLFIAGPCSAESEEQVLATAREISKNPMVNLFRAGSWKPRTRPYTFEGHGVNALKWLAKVKEETGMRVTTEVANAEHTELALKYGIDVLWIGARTTVSPFAIQEIADVLKGTDIPVLVKNPINADLQLWIGALERLHGAGINRLGAIHRGFSSYDKTKYRNPPMWSIPLELKSRYAQLPIICDPSHITGKREMVEPISQKAFDLNMDGLMIETHLDPENAISDARQQVTPASLQEMMTNFKIRPEFTDSQEFQIKLEDLRHQIDTLDRDLVEKLATRQSIVEKIGQMKKENNAAPLQAHRLESMMKEREDWASELDLKVEFIHKIFDLIHAESVDLQTKVIEDK